MIIKTPSYYKGFKCIAGACPDSCCQGWEVDADEESLEYYKTLSGEIRVRIDSVLSEDEFGNTIFRLKEKKRCPFLNDENLCDMHIAGGEYLEVDFRFVGYRSETEAEEIIHSLKILETRFLLTLDSEMNDAPPELNEIDGELYYYLLKAREKAYDIIYDRSLPVTERVIKLLDFAAELQNEIEPYEEGSDELGFFEVFNNKEVINPEWVEKVKNGKLGKVTDDYYNESICAYFIFRYFMTAVFDCDILSKVKMAAIGVLIPACFGADSWTVHLWSKETEHSQYNMDRYKELLKTAKCLNKDELKKLLM